MALSNETQLCSAISAYDLIAASYPRISDSRRFYLDSIDRLVIANVSSGAGSLLDVGAGDGRRAFKIARAANLPYVVLLEPSREMRQHWPPYTNFWAIRAEELDEPSRKFDVITCLWNVLGHIPLSARVRALRNMARFLSSNGIIFLDVTHRYNASAYGWTRTALRYLKDRLMPRDTNGDVVARWQVDGTVCATKGHVFTGREIAHLIHQAGLRIEKRFIVNYATGDLERYSFAGNLFYALRPESAS